MSMDKKHSANLDSIIQYAYEEAFRLGNNRLYPEHLFMGIIRDGSGNAFQLITDLNIDLLNIKHRIEASIQTSDEVELAQIKPLSTTEKILNFAQLEAKALKSEKQPNQYPI